MNSSYVRMCAKWGWRIRCVLLQ